MKKKVEQLLIKNFPRLKKIKLKKNDDLIKTGILDSLELVKLITILEKKHNFSFKKYQKKNNNFKIASIEKFI